MPEKFQILERHKQAIIDHALAVKPIEACGIIAGRRDATTPVGQDRLIRMNNVAEEWGTSFEFEPEQQMSVWNDIEERDEMVLAVYHSHTRHPAYPSARDIAGAPAVGARAVHIIVSVMSNIPHVCAFDISPDGTITDVELEVI